MGISPLTPLVARHVFKNLIRNLPRGNTIGCYNIVRGSRVFGLPLSKHLLNLFSKGFSAFQGWSLSIPSDPPGNGWDGCCKPKEQAIGFQDLHIFWFHNDSASGIDDEVVPLTQTPTDF